MTARSTSRVALLVPLLLAACGTVEQARMAAPVPPGARGEEVLGHDGDGWGRRGEFTLSGQRVRYERDAERLSLFEPLGTKGTRAALRFTWAMPAGDSTAACAAWSSEATANSRLTGQKPWVLSCRWSGASDATLNLGEGEMRRGQLTREGAYQRGEMTVGVRSVHLRAGNPQPQAVAVGYEFLRQGQVVGTLDLSGGAPRLHRPDPATPLGRAVGEAALAVALASDPVDAR